MFLIEHLHDHFVLIEVYHLDIISSGHGKILASLREPYDLNVSKLILFIYSNLVQIYISQDNFVGESDCQMKTTWMDLKSLNCLAESFGKKRHVGRQLPNHDH